MQALLAALRQPFAIPAITRELHRDPGAAGESPGYPLALPRFWRERRQPQHERAFVNYLLARQRGITDKFFDVLARERVAALGGRTPAARDEP